MNRAQRKKAGCRKCKHWHQGQKTIYPKGFCVIGGGYSTSGAIAVEKLKRCEDAFEPRLKG